MKASSCSSRLPLAALFPPVKTVLLVPLSCMSSMTMFMCPFSPSSMSGNITISWWNLSWSARVNYSFPVEQFSHLKKLPQEAFEYGTFDSCGSCGRRDSSIIDNISFNDQAKVMQLQILFLMNKKGMHQYRKLITITIQTKSNLCIVHILLKKSSIDKFKANPLINVY